MCLSLDEKMKLARYYRSVRLTVFKNQDFTKNTGIDVSRLRRYRLEKIMEPIGYKKNRVWKFTSVAAATFDQYLEKYPELREDDTLPLPAIQSIATSLSMVAGQTHP